MQGVHAFPQGETAASLIRWWRDAGVDTLVEDAPRGWLSAQTPAHPNTATEGFPSVREAERPQISPPLPSQGRSGELPDTLDGLLAWMRSSADIPEARWGRKRLLPAGNFQSDLMILIDAPDRGDADAGRLLSGSVGELFDKMLAAIGRDRSSIWLASFASIRPVGRVPQDVFRRMGDVARHHIGLIAPKRLLIMGDAPNRSLLGADVIASRGSLHPLNLGPVMVEAVSTFHPRLLDERPAYKTQAWKDLQLLMKGL